MEYNCKNFVQDHLNCTFEDLEQAFYKSFQTVKNDKEIYMQLKNPQQQIRTNRSLLRMFVETC
jgi:hypothetical protein